MMVLKGNVFPIISETVNSINSVLRFKFLCVPEVV